MHESAAHSSLDRFLLRIVAALIGLSALVALTVAAAGILVDLLVLIAVLAKGILVAELVGFGLLAATALGVGYLLLYAAGTLYERTTD